MAANKFATELQRSTRKIVVVLVYAVLEWVLIMLLLFNSLFYYFTKKFANFFGLKPTCLWCSSVDHLFETGRKDGSYEDLFCEAHAVQISKLSYCVSHKKLLEMQDICQECLSSEPNYNGKQVQCPQGVDLISRMRQNGSEGGHEKELSCSCCGKSFKSDPQVLSKEKLSVEEMEAGKNECYGESCNVSNEEPQILFDVGSFYSQEAAESTENEGVEDEDTKSKHCCLKIESTETISLSEDCSCVNGSFTENSPVLPTECGNGKLRDESGDAGQHDLQANEFMESNCAVIAEKENEKETKSVEIEKEEVVGWETSHSCKSDLEKQDRTSGYDEEPLNGSETSANEALDNNPDENHNEEASSYLNGCKDEKQSHCNIQESKIDDDFDLNLVVEHLLELQSERKARRDLSAELEAERSAAAVAANQTMAMITRLQEEKAAIKTEALQYQRMMEEQAEYDQEALQLLNELVTKREKEKQELEKELEIYRGRVLDYEAKEKAMTFRRSGSCSPSCSLNDDSEKLSIDLNLEVGEEGECENKGFSSTGTVLNSVEMVLHRVKSWNMLDGSLEEFEQERLSILNQLKKLEEKLFSVCDDDQEEQLLFEDVKPIEHFLETQVQNNADLCSSEVNLALKPEKHHPTTLASAAKKLLPLLEQEDSGTEQAGFDEKKLESDQKTKEEETEDKVLAIVKEMDHVYGRLHALEADREFLRHCVRSLNKGDKGVGLLEEVLQHLRELRNAGTCELMICQE